MKESIIASGAPFVRKYGNLSVQEKLVLVDRITVHSFMYANVLNWAGTSLILDIHVMVNLINNCQSKVSTGQYHMTILQDQV